MDDQEWKASMPRCILAKLGECVASHPEACICIGLEPETYQIAASSIAKEKETKNENETGNS